MSRSTGVAVAALSVLLLAAGTTGTRSQPAVSTGDRVVDAACRDIKNAQTDADLKKVADANQSNSNIALAQAFQRVSSAQEKEKRAKAALEAAKTAADNGHAWLGKVRTNESILAGYRTRQEAARAKLRTILGLETKHRQAQDELDRAG